MNEHKSFLVDLAETIDRHLPRRAQQAGTTSSRRPGWLRWLARQLAPNLGTLILVAVMLFTIPTIAAPLRGPNAASISTIPYQGRLADASGDPITDKVNIEFRIYDVPTGGAPLWTEFWTGGNAVNVSDGLFSVMLGSINTDLANVVQGQNELYLGITVGTDSEMEPRVQLGSVPFSIWSLTVADDSIDSDKIADDAVGSSEIATDAVGNDEIADGAITQEQAPFAPMVYHKGYGGGDLEVVTEPVIHTGWFHGSNEGYATYDLSSIFSQIDAVVVTKTREGGGNNKQVTFMVTDAAGTGRPIPSEVKIWAYDRDGNLETWIQAYVVVIGR